MDVEVMYGCFVKKACLGMKVLGQLFYVSFQSVSFLTNGLEKFIPPKSKLLSDFRKIVDSWVPCTKSIVERPDRLLGDGLFGVRKEKHKNLEFQRR